MDCDIIGQGCVCDDSLQVENYKLLRDHSSGIFAMGDMIEYTPDSRNDLFFWPIDLNENEGRKYTPRYPRSNSETPVLVVHAPNHRQYKGTRFLLDVVSNLQQDGVPIELKLVEKVPNNEALKIYQTADIIFDQCIVGFHGFFAIEAMAMGKAVIVYIRKPEKYLIDYKECPFINASPEKLESTLRELATDRKRLHQLGKAGRRYVEKYYTLEAFAKRLDRAYKDLDPEMSCNPESDPDCTDNLGPSDD